MRDEWFLIGRILFSLILVGSGVGHLMQAEGSAAYATAKKIPNAMLMVQISGVCLLAGGLAIILGIFMDLAALLTAVLLLIMAFMMHRFWEESDEQVQQTEMAMFMKNLSIAGGALVIFSVTSDFTPYTLTDAIF
ncbi:MAG: DoxX family protein [Actinomycetota bacterium]